MKEIYTHATQVITYLGPHHDNMVEEMSALDLLDQLHHHFVPNYSDISRDAEHGTTSISSISSYPVRHLPPDVTRDVTRDDPAWNLLLSMVNSGWMHRLWMVQENILCPQNVMLRGRKVLNWFSVAAVPILCYLGFIPLYMSDLPTDSSTSDWSSGSTFADVLDLWAHRKDHVAGKPVPNFQELTYHLERRAGRKCDDPRDRIYAVLGVCSDTAALGMSPDYALPVHEIYIDTSVRILKHGLALLRHLSVVDNLSNTLIPSWAYHDTVQQENYRRGNPGSAHPHVSNNIRFSADRTVMTLCGRLVDRVAILAPFNRKPAVYVNYHGNETWAEHYNTRLLAMNTILDHIGVSLESAGALWRVIAESYDRVTNESVTGDAYNLWLYCRFPAVLLAELFASKSTTAHGKLSQTAIDFPGSLGRLLGQEGIATPDIGSAIDFEDMLEEYCKDNRYVSLNGLSLCVSKDGRICKLTGKTRVGDLIAVLPGQVHPCVLRPCGEDRYQYVGQGYVDGVMAGELYDGVDPDEVDHDIHLV